MKKITTIGLALFAFAAAPALGHEQHGHATYSAGEPGNPKKPSRTIEVTMSEMEFTPSRIEVKRGALAGRREGDLDPPVVRGNERNRDPQLDADREHEPLVVVGVLADQVHAPGGVDHADVARPRGGRVGDPRKPTVDEMVADAWAFEQARRAGA